jgi:hypothetical protein
MTVALVHRMPATVSGTPLVYQFWRCLLRPAIGHELANGSSGRQYQP